MKMDKSRNLCRWLKSKDLLDFGYATPSFLSHGCLTMFEGLCTAESYHDKRFVVCSFHVQDFKSLLSLMVREG